MAKKSQPKPLWPESGGSPDTPESPGNGPESVPGVPEPQGTPPVQPEPAQEAQDRRKQARREPKPPPKPKEYPKFDDLGPDAQTFEEYWADHVEYVRDVQVLLGRALDENLVIMDRQICEIEAHVSRMDSITQWAESYLDVAEYQALQKIPPRDAGWTDLDRNKAMAAAVARERRFRSIVKGLHASILERISYAQSRLKAFSRSDNQGRQA